MKDISLKGVRYFRKIILLFGVFEGLRFSFLWLMSRANIEVRPLGFGGRLVVRKGSSDIHNLWQIFGDRECDIPELGVVRVVLDLGAYVGYASSYLAEKYPSAEILAVEPNPQNFSVLKENLSAFPNAKPLMFAIADSEREAAKFVVTRGSEWAGRLVSDDTNTVDVVKTKRIDSVLNEYGFTRIDLVKIDIEGGEVDLFNSSVDWCDKVRFILVEVHSQEASRAMYDFCERNGFSIIRSSGEKFLLKNSLLDI